ncbi:MAG: hypothetical protein AUJ92_11875 [Armatimonadetes bacterium CG2_30_59_28]|nr:zinc ribbon domain-containing protein [Armatimonadota bacterium]OIO93669.1 MAG: hypothetical protein AUJ92_11875 [Armatimonadetes bacterium CG2_30_59_28]PIU64069.1 MAG: hypothetical protein COS85_13805 [Armatimonadetes bacterium CG07_land_8_20_14_0_80_59_28]PIX42141.1 MAG: hypothetical protein COZ56_10075 [Armatimonadetes bacterium CG_4_8_14_3_um_filter_58_9]PIY43024.1 MAG: hypothetical protein COZ05_12385 [Armatimonadetes bacterium CG_4_10_14_3_um_filter_59_10]PJB63606.1 MAG: hypothetical 
MVHCEKCGTAVPDKARFCEGCGQPMSSGSNTPAPISGYIEAWKEVLDEGGAGERTDPRNGTGRESFVHTGSIALEDSRFSYLLGYSKLLVAFGWCAIVVLALAGAVVGLQFSDTSLQGMVVGWLLIPGGGLIVGALAGMPYIILGQWIQVFVSIENNTSDMALRQGTTNRLLALICDRFAEMEEPSNSADSSA